MRKLIIFISLFLFSFTSAYAFENISSSNLNIALIQQQFRIKGIFDSKDNLYKIVIPRTDLEVVVNGITLNPEMSLNSWISFKKIGENVSLSGDIVLSQDQVNPVMSVALANQIEVTSLYSPYFWESPRILIMHVKGQGGERRLADAMTKVFDKIQATTNGRGDFPFLAQNEVGSSVNVGHIHSILGGKISTKKGVHQFVFNKTPNMWATFSGSNANAIVEGNVAVNPIELQKALITLRKGDFFVIAIYQKEVNPDLNLIYIHYMGIGNAVALAKTLRHTLAVAQQQPAKNVLPSMTYSVNQFNILQKACMVEHGFDSPAPTHIAPMQNYLKVEDLSAQTTHKNFIEAMNHADLSHKIYNGLLLHHLTVPKSKYNALNKIIKSSPIIFSA